MSPGFGLIIMLGLAVIFYKAADMENLGLPIVWGGGSCAVYLGASQWLSFGFWGIMFLQLLLFAWMAAWIQISNRTGESESQ